MVGLSGGPQLMIATLNSSEQLANTASVTVERNSSLFAQSEVVAALTINGGGVSGTFLLNGGDLTMSGGHFGHPDSPPSSLSLASSSRKATRLPPWMRR